MRREEKGQEWEREKISRAGQSGEGKEREVGGGKEDTKGRKKMEMVRERGKGKEEVRGKIK